jgi:hypothetical protein
VISIESISSNSYYIHVKLKILMKIAQKNVLSNVHFLRLIE